jgi:predicted transcriptional regulator YdeE
MARAKKKSNIYFTKITELAIIGYNKIEDNPVLKEKLYRRFIYPAFMKMAENLINTVKPTYIDSSFQDLQTDVVTFLTERLSKFNPDAGKAYSYYTRTTYNYLIGENDRAYRKLKADTVELDIDEQRNVITEMHNEEMRETLKYFMDAYVEYCYNNLNYIFSSPHDIHVADSLLHIFENRETIEDFNKKRLYILIRERTGLDPSQTGTVTKVVKVLQQIYKETFKEYEQTNFVKLPF